MIKIAYSGSLAGFDPMVASKTSRGLLRKYLWTYNHDTVDSSTRSGYYLIQAIKLLRDKYQVGPDLIQVDWWGQIDVINLKQVADENLDPYFIHNGYLPKQVSLQRIAEADLLFLPLERSTIPGQGTLFIPGKLFEYLNTGKPILALCEESDCKSILEQSGLGLFAPPDDPEKIAVLLLQLLEGTINLAQIKPNQPFIDLFSFEKKAGELSDVFDRCLSGEIVKFA